MTSKSSSQLVAIVDDDRSVQSALKDLTESAGLEARCFRSAEEFLEPEPAEPDRLPGRGHSYAGDVGLELQAKLKAEGSRIPIIFITAHGDAKMRTQAMKAGALEFLSKPFDDEVLLEKVRGALKG